MDVAARWSPPLRRGGNGAAGLKTIVENKRPPERSSRVRIVAESRPKMQAWIRLHNPPHAIALHPTGGNRLRWRLDDRVRRPIPGGRGSQGGQAEVRGQRGPG